MQDWPKVKFFKPEEFASPDEPGSGSRMDLEFMERLDTLRALVGPLRITSGFRTPEHNAKVGGKKNSAHLKGLAADLACEDSRLRFKLINVAFDLGFKRIEICERHVHLDTDASLPQCVLIYK